MARFRTFAVLIRSSAPGMKLKKLTIKNFKSLGDVTIEPSDLTVIIGPNGSGKTNLANAFAFLKEVYANGLETAVQRSGGFENIFSAGNKDQKNTVSFELSFGLTFPEFERRLSMFSGLFELDEKLKKSFSGSEIIVNYYFSIISGEIKRKFDFATRDEHLEILSDGIQQLMFTRKAGKMNRKTAGPLKGLLPRFDRAIGRSIINISPQQLFIASHPLFNMLLRDVIHFTSGWSIYQLLPNTSKMAGVPTPNPTLSLYGSNLPVLVDFMVRKEPKVWQSILDTMRRVVPTLTDITTGYLYNKTVGLFFQEEGFERPWNAEEVSDGTILTLAMLCSVNDPRSTLVFIEEPENSIHPWILRELIQNFKGVAGRKDILVTTHSPTLIDMVSPHDIWCISKSNRKTQLNRLTDIAENLQADWEAGIYKTSDYLDSGLVPQAIPGGSL